MELLRIKRSSTETLCVDIKIERTVSDVDVQLESIQKVSGKRTNLLVLESKTGRTLRCPLHIETDVRNLSFKKDADIVHVTIELVPFEQWVGMSSSTSGFHRRDGEGKIPFSVSQDDGLPPTPRRSIDGEAVDSEEDSFGDNSVDLQRQLETGDEADERKGQRQEPISTDKAADKRSSKNAQESCPHDETKDINNHSSIECKAGVNQNDENEKKKKKKKKKQLVGTDGDGEEEDMNGDLGFRERTAGKDGIDEYSLSSEPQKDVVEDNKETNKKKKKRRKKSKKVQEAEKEEEEKETKTMLVEVEVMQQDTEQLMEATNVVDDGIMSDSECEIDIRRPGSEYFIGEHTERHHGLASGFIFYEALAKEASRDKSKQPEDKWMLKPDCSWRITYDGDEPDINKCGNMVRFGMWAVFDGHGGKQTATFASNQLKKYILDAVASPINCSNNDEMEAEDLELWNSVKLYHNTFTPVSIPEISGASEECLKEWEATLELVKRLPSALHFGFTKCNKEAWKRFKNGGTTATVAFVVGRNLIVANVGDSCAYLDTGYEVLAVSSNHRLEENEEERKRIEASGGEVARSTIDGTPAGPLRVWPGGLAMGRTIGDVDAGELATSEPEIKVVSLPEGGGRLFLGSDGLWDAVHPKTAAHHCRGANSTEAAHKLLHLAIKKDKLKDDVTVVVVDLVPSEMDKMPPAILSNTKAKQTQEGEEFSVAHSVNVWNVSDIKSRPIPLAEIDSKKIEHILNLKDSSNGESSTESFEVKTFLSEHTKPVEVNIKEEEKPKTLYEELAELKLKPEDLCFTGSDEHIVESGETWQQVNKRSALGSKIATAKNPPSKSQGKIRKTKLRKETDRQISENGKTQIGDKKESDKERTQKFRRPRMQKKTESNSMQGLEISEQPEVNRTTKPRPKKYKAPIVSKSATYAKEMNVSEGGAKVAPSHNPTHHRQDGGNRRKFSRFKNTREAVSHSESACNQSSVS